METLIYSIAKGHFSEVTLQELLERELADRRRAKAWGIDRENGRDSMQERSRLLLAVYPDLVALCDRLALGNIESLLPTVWQLWLPLAMQLAAARQQLNRPLIQGILGGQGTGKTTLAAVLSLILGHLGYATLSLSIDDLYKTYEERKQLQIQDPRLIWRGPPGTHDVNLGINLLKQLRSHHPTQTVLIPRFDKSLHNGAGDRTTPEAAPTADIVLFEGWFVGVRPADKNAFDSPPSPIITPEDCCFARDTNQSLEAYLPLWELLDRLIVLCPCDYRLSKQWRQEAEHKMIATGKSGMSDAEIDRFVEYFWQALHPELFIAPLTQNPQLADLVIEINSDHTSGLVYIPGDLS